MEHNEGIDSPPFAARGDAPGPLGRLIRRPASRLTLGWRCWSSWSGSRPVRLSGTENRHKAIQKVPCGSRGAPERPETTVQNGIKSEKSYDHRIRGVGHIVRNLQHLQGSGGHRNSKAFSLQNTYAEVATLAICFARSSGCPRELRKPHKRRQAGRESAWRHLRPAQENALDQQELARELVKNGKSISAVARTFNVHPATIYRVIEG